MNINQSILCDVCNSGINFRYQVGFVEDIKIKFCCPKCGTPININLKIQQFPQRIIPTIKNASFTEENFQTMEFSFQASSEYVTPKSFLNPYNTFSDSNPYLIFNLLSPFIQAQSILGGDNLIKFKEHCLSGISSKKYFNIYERLNYLFFSKSPYFVSEINKQFKSLGVNDIKVENNDKSMLEGIYYFNIRYFDSFLCNGYFEEKNKIILENINLLKEKNIDEFNKLVEKFTEDNKINTYEKRILRTIDNYINHFEELIPAISLNYLKDPDSLNAVFSSFTTRTMTFSDIKNIYLEVYENLLEIYDLIVALNNIFYRNDFNTMHKRPKSLGFLKSNNVKYLDDFSNLNKGCKLHYLKIDEVFNKLMPNLDNKMRNTIGHESWEYDEYSQKIKSENNIQEKSLLEYAYECYNMFLNCVVIYKLIVDIKYNKLK